MIYFNEKSVSYSEYRLSLSLSLWLLSTNQPLCMQDPLPGPKDPNEIDPGLGDAELFEAAFLPNPSDGIESLGDLWSDVLLQHQFAFKSVAGKFFFKLSIPIYLHLCPTAQADVPAVLRYLAGCKYLRPRGKWVMASGPPCSQVCRT